MIYHNYYFSDLRYLFKTITVSNFAHKVGKLNRQDCILYLLFKVRIKQFIIDFEKNNNFD